MKMSIILCAFLLGGIVACDDSPSDYARDAQKPKEVKQSEEEVRKAADEADAARKVEEERARKEAAAAKLQADLDAAKQEAEDAKARAEEIANAHYDIVMQVAGHDHETTIYSNLSMADVKAKWLILSTELNAGRKFFVVDDPNDVTASIMVRPEVIQYITINTYRP